MAIPELHGSAAVPAFAGAHEPRPLPFDAFANLGADGVPGETMDHLLARAFGSFSRWEAEFRRTASALAGGSGRAILAVTSRGELHNYWAWDHTSGAPESHPLLVLDMYEHAYHLDYGAAAGQYVDAFMRNVDWDQVRQRLLEATAPRRGSSETWETTWNPG